MTTSLPSAIPSKIIDSNYRSFSHLLLRVVPLWNNSRTILWKMEFTYAKTKSVSSLVPFSPVHSALKLAQVFGTQSENSYNTRSENSYSMQSENSYNTQSENSYNKQSKNSYSTQSENSYSTVREQLQHTAKTNFRYPLHMHCCCINSAKPRPSDSKPINYHINSADSIFSKVKLPVSFSKA